MESAAGLCSAVRVHIAAAADTVFIF